MRTNNPAPRELEVEWSTQGWTPRISFRAGAGGDRVRGRLEIAADWSILFGRKPMKRRAPMAVRRDGSRPT